MAARPPIVPRSQWGGRGSRSGTIAPSRRSYYVVHYPVMGNRDERQWMREMETMHINQGWGMIGYSYCIGQSGTIYEGCGLNTRPIHSPPRNSDAWGVCHLLPTTAQGVATAQISNAMKNASVALYNWLGSQAGRQLQRWWHGRDHPTSCPGADLRAWVQQGMPATGGAPAPAPTPEPEGQMIDMLTMGGQTMVFNVAEARTWVGVTWQGPKSNEWHGKGRGGGYPAGFVPFAAAPRGHRITGITARQAANGSGNVIIRTDKGETFSTWTNKDGGWSGRTGGYHAGFSNFAAKP